MANPTDMPAWGAAYLKATGKKELHAPPRQAAPPDLKKQQAHQAKIRDGVRERVRERLQARAAATRAELAQKKGQQ